MEVYETFAHILRQNRSLRELLKSDYVVVNGLLANYYGLPGVVGDQFQVVKLPVESPRGGLLGMAAIHGMGSNGEHASPVERGAWVLRKLLNDPPPPAPANVPQLTRLEDKLLTTRERLSMHQEEPQCASCHRKIDPIGFGLENFDDLPEWSLTAIDVSLCQGKFQVRSGGLSKNKALTKPQPSPSTSCSKVSIGSTCQIDFTSGIESIKFRAAYT